MTLGLDIRRPHAGAPSPATFSADRTYRYQLTRRWGSGPDLLILDLRPGTADEHHDDLFTKSYTGFARRFGYDGYTVVSLYAAVVTAAGELNTHRDPVGPDNDAWIDRLARRHDVIVFAWGSAAPYRARAGRVASRIWRTCQTTGASVAACGWSAEAQPRNPSELDNFTLSTLTGNSHRDFRDVDPRWVHLLADTADLAA